MNANRPHLSSTPVQGLPRTLYRYFFYGWLFQDADSGTAIERSAAVRHNRAQAKWLPTYLRRWAVCAVLAWWVEQIAEAFMLQSVVPGLLATFAILILVNLMFITIHWAFLTTVRR